jgi:HAMP domain-containing protein
MLVMPRWQLLAQAHDVLLRQLWLGAAGLALLIAAISFVATGVSRPIHRLAEAVSGAREGDLDFPLPADTRGDETGVLTAALRRLRDSLKLHVQLRAESIAAQSRLAHELQIAASIQQSHAADAATTGRLPHDVRVSVEDPRRSEATRLRIGARGPRSCRRTAQNRSHFA